MTDFPQATIDATRWLAKNHPERLESWLTEHPKGLREAAGLDKDLPAQAERDQFDVIDHGCDFSDDEQAPDFS